jgi:hypothetical protein
VDAPAARHTPSAGTPRGGERGGSDYTPPWQRSEPRGPVRGPDPNTPAWQRNDPLRPQRQPYTHMDAANDPRWDDPLARQVELDKLKPDYLRPEPGKPRPEVDTFSHIPPDPMDPRALKLADSVGDPPHSNVREWMGNVNPDYGTSKHYQMNCPEVGRNVTDILYGKKPRLAAGNKFKSGEQPDSTLEWMDLEDFKPEHKMWAHPDPNANPADFTNAAYRRVVDALTGRRPGTHADIFVTWRGSNPKIPGGGHVFNAFVDDTGRVKFLDAQPEGGKLEDAFPEGHTGPDPANPYWVDTKLPDGSTRRDLIDITSIKFAVREPGGTWEGVPRTLNTPPASLSQIPRPHPQRGDTPPTPDLRTPDPNTPDPNALDPNTPGPHTPAPGTPDPRTPEANTPGSGDSHGGIGDWFNRRTRSDSAPSSPQDVARAGERPASPSPRPEPELADRRFQASAQDEAEFVRRDRDYQPGRIEQHRERGRLQPSSAIDNLTDFEIRALEKLLRPDHQYINTAYRAGDLRIEHDPTVRLAVSAMNKMPDVAGTVRRGIEIDDLTAFVQRYAPGSTIREPAFQHSAKTRDGAFGFNVQLEIDARHGKDLSFLRPGFDEVMHPPHTTFHSTEMRYDEANRTLHVKLRDYGGPPEPPPGGWPPLPTVPDIDPRRAALREQQEAIHRPITPQTPQTPIDPFAGRPSQYQPQPWQQPQAWFDPMRQQPQQPYPPGQRPSSPPQYGGQSSQPQYGGQPSQPQYSGQSWRPGDPGFGVSNKPGFDPAFHHKALGDQFSPGVHDPDSAFQDKEREIADRLEQEGWRVDARPEDHGKAHMKNPESMVRKDPADGGLITEFKTPNSGSKAAIKRLVNSASKQVPPAGEVVIDGRNVGLTEELAKEAYKSARRQPGATVAAKVHFILADGRIVTRDVTEVV